MTLALRSNSSLTLNPRDTRDVAHVEQGRLEQGRRNACMPWSNLSSLHIFTENSCFTYQLITGHRVRILAWLDSTETSSWASLLHTKLPAHF